MAARRRSVGHGLRSRLLPTSSWSKISPPRVLPAKSVIWSPGSELERESKVMELATSDTRIVTSPAEPSRPSRTQRFALPEKARPPSSYGSETKSHNEGERPWSSPHMRNSIMELPRESSRSTSCPRGTPAESTSSIAASPAPIDRRRTSGMPGDPSVSSAPSDVSVSLATSSPFARTIREGACRQRRTRSSDG